VRNTFCVMRSGMHVLIAVACLALGGCAVIEWPVKQITLAVREMKKPTLSQAVANLASTDADVRRESLNIIAENKAATGDPKLIEIVGTLLNGDPARNTGPDKSQLVRVAAAQCLGQIGESKITMPILATALDNKSNIPLVRREIVRALGRVGKGDQAVIAKLLAFARNKDENADVRREAALALGQAGDESLVPDLVALLKEEKGGELRVALGARDALRKITGKPFGAEDPDIWLVWIEDGYNQEIVDRYVAGQLELGKMRPRAGPVAEKIPESVSRVFKGFGAELALSGKSFIDGAARIASVPVGAAKLALKGPRRALHGRSGTGVLKGLGNAVIAVPKFAATAVAGAVRKLGNAIGAGYQKLFHPEEKIEIRTESTE